MRILYCLATATMFFMSCYTPRYMYSPPAHNVPVLVKQGDSKLSAAYSSNLSMRSYENNKVNESKNRGFDLQGACAITGNFAIQANYFNRKERNNGDPEKHRLDSSDINYKRYLTEIGIGYFKSLDTRDLVLFQVFSGAGKGRFSFTDNGKDRNDINYSRSHQADITKFYIQPAMLFRTRGNFSAAISTRFSFIWYGNIKTNYTPAELADYKLDSLAYGVRTFWEPAFVNSIGFKKLPGIMIEYQLGTAILLSRRVIDYRSFNFSLAVVFDLPKLLKGKSGSGKD